MDMRNIFLFILFLLPYVGVAQDYSKSELIGEWTFDMLITDALGKKDTIRDNYVPNFKFTLEEIFVADEYNDYVSTTDRWAISETNDIVIYDPVILINSYDYDRIIESGLAEKRIAKFDNDKYYYTEPTKLHIKTLSDSQLILEENGGTIIFKRL